jgi:hypothetical protein
MSGMQHTNGSIICSESTHLLEHQSPGGSLSLRSKSSVTRLLLHKSLRLLYVGFLLSLHRARDALHWNTARYCRVRNQRVECAQTLGESLLDKGASSVERAFLHGLYVIGAGALVRS